MTGASCRTILQISTIAIVAVGGAVVAASGNASATLASPPGGSWTPLPAAPVYSGSLAGGATHRVQVAGVPAGAAAWLTVSESGAARSGAVSVYTAAGVVPPVPTVPFAAGQNASNSAVVRTSSAGQVDVRNTSTAATTVRVDVSGYYAGGAPAQAGMFGPVQPLRVANAVSVTAGHSVSVTVTGSGGVPSTAAVVLANLAVAAPNGSGVLTAYPAGAAKPDFHTVTFSAGRPTAALSAVRVGTGRTITVVNTSSVPVTLSATVLGYYLPGTPTTGRAFTKLAPAPVLNTATGLRAPRRAVAAHGVVTAKVAGAAGVPAVGVRAVVLEVSVSAASAAGYLTAYPAGTTRPTTPYARFSPGRGTSALIEVPSGQVSLDNASSGTVQIRADIVGYYAYASTLSWSAPKRVSTTPDADLTAVSCPTPSFCMAIAADGNTIRYDGTRWTRTLIALPPGEWALSCPTTAFCMALDGASHTRRWTGSTWSSAGSAPGPHLDCVSPSFCLAASDRSWATWNGTAWSAASALPLTGLTSLSCPSATACVAAFVHQTGDAVDSARFDGRTWSATTPITGVGGTTATPPLLSCAAASFCLAIGAATDTWAAYDGRAWNHTGSAPAAATYDAVYCPSAAFCAALLDDGLVIDGVGQVDAVTFDGSAWSSPSTIGDAVRDRPALSCVSSRLCAATVNAGVSRWNGSAWAAPVTVDPDGNAPVVAVSCSSSTSCAEVGPDYGRVWNGSTWTPPVKLTQTSPCCGDYNSNLSDVSCVSSTFCIASISGGEDIDSGGGFARWNGRSWSVHDETFSTGENSVSCVSTTFCAAVGVNVDLLRNPITVYEAAVYDGVTWSKTFRFAHEITHVSCVTATFCVGIGTNGTRPVSTVFNGSTWSALTPFGDANATVTALSCQTRTFCVAVNSMGRAATFNGSRWNAPASVAPRALSDISCEQAAACVAVSAEAGAVQYLGSGSWRAPARIDPAGGPAAVSCASATFCMVGDTRGYVTIGRSS